jgi:hypothetical protein
MQKDCVSFNTEVLFESVNHFHFKKSSSFQIHALLSFLKTFALVQILAARPRGTEDDSILGNGRGTGDSRIGDFLFW